MYKRTFAVQKLLKFSRSRLARRWPINSTSCRRWSWTSWSSAWRQKWTPKTRMRMKKSKSCGKSPSTPKALRTSTSRWGSKACSPRTTKSWASSTTSIRLWISRKFPLECWRWIVWCISRAIMRRTTPKSFWKILAERMNTSVRLGGPVLSWWRRCARCGMERNWGGFWYANFESKIEFYIVMFDYERSFQS